MNGTTASVRVRVELFGTPRIQAGTGEVELAVPYPANRRNLVSALAGKFPTLVSHCLKEDLTDLDDGYVFNLNGLAFLGDEDFTLDDGDSLLLFSSQAGG